MKKILLIFLLTLSSYATEQVAIPNEVCIHQLENIIEKGWSDSNQTLNNIIIKGGESSVPKILKLLDKPILIKEGASIDDMPKFLLVGNDYIKLFSYVKYLEHNGEEKKAYDIAIKALKGLNNTESKALVAIMVHVMYEKIIVKSLKESLQHHRFSKEQKVALKKELRKLLLLDNKLLFETIDYESIATNKLLKDAYSKENGNKEQKEMISKMLFYFKKYYSDYNAELKKAISSDSLDELEAHRQKEIEEFKNLKNYIKLSTDYLKRKLAKLLSLKPDYTEQAKNIAKTIFLVAPIASFKTYKEYMTQVKSNQEFWESI
jgi:hypothetical protein